MLTADKNATLTGFQIQTLDIRSKELNYFVSLYNCVSNMAAFVAGFAFSNLTSELPEDTNYIVKGLFLIITASSIGLEICSIGISTVCSVFGISYD